MVVLNRITRETLNNARSKQTKDDATQATSYLWSTSNKTSNAVGTFPSLLFLYSYFVLYFFRFAPIYYFTLCHDTPFCRRTYLIPISQLLEVNRQIKEMLVWGVIELDVMEYVSPLVTVGKKYGSRLLRVRLDTRYLNAIMCI